AARTEAGPLARLDLAHNRLGDEGAAALAAWPGLASLVALDLEDNLIGAGGVKALRDSPHAASLMSLGLAFNDAGPEPEQEPGFEGATEAQISLMERSFGLLAAMGPRLVARFYSELFARCPQVKPLFARTDMRKQQQHLLAAL